MNFAKWELMLDTTLNLPDVPELQELLRHKLADYRKRIEGFKKKYKSKKLGVILDRNSNLLDAWYKSEIVEALLDKGQIDVRQMHDQIADEFDGNISEDVFSNAVSVINDYIRTGGIHTEGGSGFFTDDTFRKLLSGSKILEYPEDAARRAELQNKYFEFLGRKADIEQHLDTTVDRAAQKRNGYRVRILAELKERQRLIIPELADALAKEEGKTFDRIEFYNAVCHVRDLISGRRRQQRDATRSPPRSK